MTYYVLHSHGKLRISVFVWYVYFIMLGRFGRIVRSSESGIGMCYFITGAAIGGEAVVSYPKLIFVKPIQ